MHSGESLSGVRQVYVHGKDQNQVCHHFPHIKHVQQAAKSSTSAE